MADQYHQCKNVAPTTFLFLATTGEFVEMSSENLPATSPFSPNYNPTGMAPSSPPKTELPSEVVRYLKSKKLCLDGTASADEPNGQNSSPFARVKKANLVPEGSSTPSPPLVASSGSASPAEAASSSRVNTPNVNLPTVNIPRGPVQLSMVYNEYGELVSAESILNPGHSKYMTKLQILRIIKKKFHFNWGTKMMTAITEHLGNKGSSVVDGGRLIWGDRLSAWEFRPRSPMSTKSTGHDTTLDETPQTIAVYNGPPRVLEIGCGDGGWCFLVKKRQPDWIVEGIDDADHWSCVNPDLNLRDFMKPDPSGSGGGDYFSGINAAQEYPEFSVRNINHLLKNDRPLPQNQYDLIRAWDIFDKVESFKAFLDDCRLILLPGGVVEFLEVDPRPRMAAAGPNRSEAKADHTSGPMTGWSNRVADRFRVDDDEQLAPDVPGWMTRTLENLAATLRPRDGIPAPQLKSWLQGSGFYDVHQTMIRLPVGGSTKAGQLLSTFIIWKHENEDTIPNLKDALPEIELDAIKSGDYYLNLHIVTGRKPHLHRAGDLLPDGSRQEMTASKYEIMARKNDSKSHQWQRFDLDDQFTGLVHELSSLHGAPAKSALTLDPTVSPLVSAAAVAGTGAGGKKVDDDPVKHPGVEEVSTTADTAKEVHGHATMSSEAVAVAVPAGEGNAKDPVGSPQTPVTSSKVDVDVKKETSLPIRLKTP